MKEAIFCTLLTVSVVFVVPIEKGIIILGGTTVQPLQEADDSPSSEGKVVVSSPPGAPEDTVIARVTEIVALLLYADGYITNVLKEAGFAIVIEITPIDFSTAHP